MSTITTPSVTLACAQDFIRTPEGMVAAATALRLIRLARTDYAQMQRDLDMHRRELGDERAVALFDRVIGLMATREEASHVS